MKTTAVLSDAIRWFQTCRNCEDKFAIESRPIPSFKASRGPMTDSDHESDSEKQSVMTPSCPPTPLPATHSFSTEASHTLDVVIVGAGIGGLAIGYLLGTAGHRVTILESAPELSEVGAGIQLSPNATRLLARWGLGEQLQNVAVAPQNISLKRYSDGEVVGWKPWGSSMVREHGSPYYQVHRADLHQMLIRLLDSLPVTIHLNSNVSDVDPSLPLVTLASGEIIHCDLVIGADGLRSTVRTVVVGREDAPEPTGDAAYRAVIPAELILADPDLRGLVENPALDIWMGSGRHVVGYCIRKQTMYNLVMVHPARDSDMYATAKDADLNVMKADFADFEPRVQKLLDLASSALVWPLMDRRPMENWIHPSGKVCLLGDACHPTLPYRAQGAALALEDAAVLGNLLSRLQDKSQLPDLLRAYQDLRITRASATQLASRANQTIFHLADGPNRETRDASMRDAMESAVRELGGDYDVDDHVGCQNMWGDRQRNRETFDYDADAEVEKWFEEHCQFGKHTVNGAPLYQRVMTGL